MSVPYVATLVRSGGLWHAGSVYHVEDGSADTLCGRIGWVDHANDNSPVPAVDNDPEAGQPVECLTCLRIMRAEMALAG